MIAIIGVHDERFLSCHRAPAYPQERRSNWGDCFASLAMTVYHLELKSTVYAEISFCISVPILSFILGCAKQFQKTMTKGTLSWPLCGVPWEQMLLFLVPSWHRKGTQLASLKWPENQPVADHELKKVPSCAVSEKHSQRSSPMAAAKKANEAQFYFFRGALDSATLEVVECSGRRQRIA
jgi:hypothetical protein